MAGVMRMTDEAQFRLSDLTEATLKSLTLRR